MADEKLQRLEIVTPERKVYTEDVRMVVLPGSEGEFGGLPDHAALVS
ncbi:MAG: F0F1 ATP synthase subunit epsilon, partial [Firmicutes bacterium]|nr:F0F1 ATP synthase subunit epsilon [Bacillota bacterium]